MDNMSQPIIYQ